MIASPPPDPWMALRAILAFGVLFCKRWRVLIIFAVLVVAFIWLCVVAAKSRKPEPAHPDSNLMQEMLLLM